jgi:predicted transcriptional regulator
LLSLRRDDPGMPQSTENQPQNTNVLIERASAIVSAYVGNNPIAVSELPAIIKNIHAALAGLSNSGSEATVTTQKPAVPIKRSVASDHIVCLEDGKKLKMLKRYLRTRYHLSPDEYRAKWGLPRDYPMVAPEYAERRSEFAKKIGLGRTRPEKAAKKRKRA